jgi:hypothetical protein
MLQMLQRAGRPPKAHSLAPGIADSPRESQPVAPQRPAAVTLRSRKS